MSEPDGPDATRRTLLRGVVVLGVVGVGAGLSRLGEGTVDLPSTTAAESDVAAPSTPVETAEPAASAEPIASAAPTASAKPTKKPARPTKSAKPEAAAKPTKAAKTEAAAKPKAVAKAAKPAGKPLGPTDKVPVGGGVVYKADRVVVTQPTAGVYKAFDAQCTHANCLVGEVKGGVIHCPCHNAEFSIADGSATKFPARRPLPPKTVTESGGTIYLT